jgi:hypothetical protein
MGCRVARSQGALTLLILAFIGWLAWQDATFQVHPTLHYPFRERFGRTSHQEAVFETTPSKEDGIPVKGNVPQRKKDLDIPDTKDVPQRTKDLDLPDFCDYCGPNDELCQKYG